MKANLRNSVGEIYKRNNNSGFVFNGNKNNNSNSSNEINVNMNKNNIINNNINDVISENNNSDVNSFPFLKVLIIVLLLGTIIFIIYSNRLAIKKFFNGIFKNDELEKQNEKHQKEIDELKEKIESEAKKREAEKSEDKQNVEKKEAPVQKPREVPKDMKKMYGERQFVKENSFCYIGSDDNMRHCLEVYEGDVCESGDIYKRIDECLVPKKLE